MDELIRVNYTRKQPLVSARELHEGLEIRTRYTTWFERIQSLGFIEGQDFFPEMGESIGGRPGTEHFISVDMAKQICMLQRTEKGKMYRQYFLELEKAWNSPEQVMARALQLANQTVEELKARCMFLGRQVESQQKTIAVIEPKARYLDQILGSDEQLIVTQIAKDYGMSAQRFNKILSELQIQYKRNEQWVLYAGYHDKGYTQSRTVPITLSDGRMSTREHTVWTQKGRLFLYNILKENGILPLVEREVDILADAR